MSLKYFTFILSLIFMVGCTNETYEKAVDQGNLALANKEYDKAIASFELAISEEEDEDIQKLITKIEKLLISLEQKQQGDLDKAIMTIEESLGLKVGPEFFDRDLEGQRDLLLVEKSDYEKIAAEIKNGDELVASNKLNEAKAVFEKIVKQVKDKPQFLALDKLSAEKLSNVMNMIQKVEGEEARKRLEEEEKMKLDEELRKKREQVDKEKIKKESTQLSLDEMRKRAKAYVDNWNGYDNLLVDEYNSSSGDVRVYEFKDGDAERIVGVTVNLKTGEVKGDGGM